MHICSQERDKCTENPRLWHGSRMRVRLIPTLVVVTVVALVAGACNRGSEIATRTTPPEEETTSPTEEEEEDEETTTTAAGDVARPTTTALSSSGTFDANGRNAVYLTSIDTSRRKISFDVIQFLTGDAAVQEYRRQNPDDPQGEPPNDYMIRNENTQVRTAGVDAGVVVQLVRLREDGDADLDPGTFDELPRYLEPDAPPDSPFLSHNPFWLTLRNGVVVRIEEQYVP